MDPAAPAAARNHQDLFAKPSQSRGQRRLAALAQRIIRPAEQWSGLPLENPRLFSARTSVATGSALRRTSR